VNNSFLKRWLFTHAKQIHFCGLFCGLIMCSEPTIAIYNDR